MFLTPSLVTTFPPLTSKSRLVSAISRPPSATASQNSIRNLSFHDLSIFFSPWGNRLDPFEVSHFQRRKTQPNLQRSQAGKNVARGILLEQCTPRQHC